MKMKQRPTWLFKTRIGTIYKYDDNGNMVKKKKFYRRKIDHKTRDARLVTIFFEHLSNNPKIILRALEKMK
jgi:hypothetical protein